MAETDQQFSPVDGLEGLNATTNSTTNDTVTSSILANLQDVNFILLEAKIIFGAMGIIYLGAHAALRRPPSAAPPKSKKTGKTRRDEDRFSQGLERSDAIMFPLMAAGILVGLYYLIQWLKDPAIINKILQYYMSFMSIASLLTLYAHGIEFFTGLVFPRFWKRKDGGILRVNQKRRLAVRCDEGGNEIATPTSASDASPLPGVLGLLAPSARLRNLVWDIRDLLTKRWTFRFFAHGIADEKAKFKFAHVLALSLALASAGIYFSTTSPLLSNLLGYGMCYGSMLLLSPTDFVTGALVLVGLFVYDIVMVFYT
jgi:minor histocompatibility antigen H13